MAKSVISVAHLAVLAMAIVACVMSSVIPVAASLTPRNAGTARIAHFSPGPKSLFKRGDGRATYYAVGLGACGKYNNDGEMVAALNHIQYGVSHDSPMCGQCLRIWSKESSAPAVIVRIVDKCPGCTVNDLDLSPAAFTHFHETGKGVFHIEWTFAPCNGGGIGSVGAGVGVGSRGTGQPPNTLPQPLPLPEPEPQTPETKPAPQPEEEATQPPALPPASVVVPNLKDLLEIQERLANNSRTEDTKRDLDEVLKFVKGGKAAPAPLPTSSATVSRLGRVEALYAIGTPLLCALLPFARQVIVA